MNIANRNTVSKRYAEIDSLYVYATHHKIKFTHRHQSGAGYPYFQNGVKRNAGPEEIHIYHRTVIILGVSRGLTMVTKQSKYREAQRFFNESIKQIEESDELFEKFSHATSSPTELGIKYLY